jgi:hypothetical protein
VFRIKCSITVFFHLWGAVFFKFEHHKLWSNLLVLWQTGDVRERERVRLYDSRLFVVDLSDDDAYHIGLLLLSLRRPAEFSASTVQGHPVLLTVRAHSGLGWEPHSLKAKL